MRRTALLIYGAAVTVLLVLLGRNALTGSEGALAQSVREIAMGMDVFAGEGIFAPQSAANLFAGKIYWLWSCAAGVSEWSLRLLTAVFALLLFSGKNPYTVLKKAALAAEKILEGRVMTVGKKPFPQIFEYLGWCSWDAMRCHISEEKLKVKANEFKEKNIPVRWCILDDMWGHVKDLKGQPEEISTHDLVKIMHQSTLYALEADPDRFPNGLKGAIDNLHEAGFKVGVWYPTTGYWKGLAPAKVPRAQDPSNIPW